ncbi:MAG: nucleotide exchange factor GrpE, partial [Pseudomonadota bacterium]
AGDGKEVTVDSLVKGTEMTLKLLQQGLEKFEVMTVDPLGEPFDPEFHEALSMQPSADAEPNSVLMVVQKGYRLHDRLLRPARVIVAQAVEAQES